MADIELVIKIPEDDLNTIKYLKSNGWASRHELLILEGHGTLKDVDNIKTAFPSGEYVRTESVRATIDHEETMIEADKESEGVNDL